MSQKIFNFITSRSEHTRKIIAGTIVALAGIMLFFAWSAGVSARLPLLGTALDTVSTVAISAQETRGQTPETPTATAVSPMKGLIDSFQDLARLFRGEYPAMPDSSSTASSSPTRPIDELFDTIADETPSATSTENADTGGTEIPDNLPPAEELPGL